MFNRSVSVSLEKTADISCHYHWLPREMTSEEGAQKLHTDDASLGQVLGSVFDWLKQIFNRSEALPRSW